MLNHFATDGSAIDGSGATFPGMPHVTKIKTKANLNLHER